MRLLNQLTEPPRPCSYLGDATASLQYRVMTGVQPAELESLLVRGWRRFGPVYFRPACAACDECRSIRIPVDRFRPTASQARAVRRARRFTLAMDRPRVDAERLALYAAWHERREADRQWSPSPLDRDEYVRQFAFPHPAAWEVTFREEGRLVALGLVDVTPQALSLVYFFYHPGVARLSPGIANVGLAVEQARSRGIPHVYLGYRVLGCASMSYKAQFRPHELLQGRPDDGDTPVWREDLRPG